MNESNECFECGNPGPLHDHHVVPRILGGTKTVPLCEVCHGKVHGRDMVGHSRLIRAGLKTARDAGRTLGRRVGSSVDPTVFLAKNAEVVRLLGEGVTIRRVATLTGKAKVWWRKSNA